MEHGFGEEAFGGAESAVVEELRKGLVEMLFYEVSTSGFAEFQAFG